MKVILFVPPGGCLFNGAFCFGSVPPGGIASPITAYLNPATSQTSLQGLSDIKPQAAIQYVCQNSLLRQTCRQLIGASPPPDETASVIDPLSDRRAASFARFE